MARQIPNAVIILTLKKLLHFGAEPLDESIITILVLISHNRKIKKCIVEDESNNNSPNPKSAKTTLNLQTAFQNPINQLITRQIHLSYFH